MWTENNHASCARCSGQQVGRAMESERLSLEDVDLAEFLPPILEAVRPIAPRTFTLAGAPHVTAHVDRRQLRGAITGLLDNAIHATSERDGVSLGATLDDASGDVAIAVEDAGPGIPAAQRESALQRFSRPGARDEDGSGLGLAIAKAVALAHGGTIRIDQSPTLGGARVVLILPRSAVRSGVG